MLAMDYSAGVVLPITAHGEGTRLGEILNVGNAAHTLILSAMLVEWDWLFASIGSIPMLVFVDGASGLPASVPKSQWKKGIRHPQNPACQIFAPPAAPYSKMHAKLAMVITESFMRLMITSANLVQGDWEERPNVSYVQDFPDSEDPSDGGDFCLSLCHILRSLGLVEGLLHQIRTKYNYEKALVRMESPPFYHRDISLPQFLEHMQPIRRKNFPLDLVGFQA